jgi:hypothetical protein
VPWAIAALCIGAGCIGGPAHAQEANGPGNAPCRQIREACTQAGFKPGAAKDGVGLIVDCVRPIMQGVPQPAKAAKPFPSIDAGLIAACKAANPDFGQQRKSTASPPAGGKGTE